MARPGGRGAPLKLLVLNWLDRENPKAGGAETHLHEVFGRMADRGHEVTLLCSGFPGGARRALLDGIQVHRTGGRYTFGIAAPLYYRRHLAGSDFDLVVEDLNKVPVFAPLWSGKPVTLLVHHLFGTTAFREASAPVATATWLLERSVPWTFRGLPTVAVSESTARELEERGLDPADVQVIPNGVELDHFRPDPSVARFPSPTLVYVGRLKRYKRLDLVMFALSLLRDRGVPCCLLVAGRGDYKDSLLRLRARLGLGDRVELLGYVDEERKVELLRRAWIHVLTSEKEGWGISNLEAAACGTPTVASDSPGLRDSVRDGETGRLVPHGHVEALADALQTLLEDGALRDGLGRGARRFAEGFSWGGIADRWERFLLDVRARTARATPG